MQAVPAAMVLLCLALSAVAAAAPRSNGTTYAPDDANIYYSPFAWHVNGSSASTINSASCAWLPRAPVATAPAKPDSGSASCYPRCTTFAALACATPASQVPLSRCAALPPPLTAQRCSLLPP
jgi:hypothetical protein